MQSNDEREERIEIADYTHVEAFKKIWTKRNPWNHSCQTSLSAGLFVHYMRLCERICADEMIKK